MEYLSKASLDKKTWREYMIKISLVGTISLVGLILAVFSIVSGDYLFSFWYFVAFCLGLSYVIIRINTVFPTYIATDGEKVILSQWENGIVPYKLPEKPSFISDFIPAKVKTDEIKVSDIDSVIIGSKKYFLRNLIEEEYPTVFKKADEDKHFDNTLKRMDFIYIKAKDGENCFMSITNFDIEKIAELIGIIEKNCVGVQIHTNIPKLVKIRNNAIKKA